MEIRFGDPGNNKSAGFGLRWIITLWGILNLIMPVVQGSFNLYLSADEMRRLLGLTNELYYVREGVVNEYALNFIVTVPAHVNALHFTWQALGQKPTRSMNDGTTVGVGAEQILCSYQDVKTVIHNSRLDIPLLHPNWLPYSASLESSDSLAMGKPSLNITAKGFIPTKTQIFHVLLPCTSDLSDEVDLSLTLNVSFAVGFKLDHNTTITLRRKKICLKDPTFKLMPTTTSSSHLKPPTSVVSANSNKKHKQSSKHGNSDGKPAVFKISKPNNNDDDINVAAPAPPDNTNLMYIVLGSSIAVMLTIALAAVAILRTRKENSEGAESSDFLHVDTSGNGSSGSGSGGGSLFTRPESPHHYTSVSPCCLDSDAYTYSTFHPSNPNPFYSEIPACNNKGHHSNPGTNTNTATTTTITMDYATGCKLADKMTIARCKVRLQSVIMEGTFAKIYNGTVLEKGGLEKKVVVKTVSDHSSPVQMALLLHEGLSLVGMGHQHVFSVIGVAAEERVPPFLIYPDDGFRNLKRFLQRCRSGTGRLITAQEIVHMAVQIGSGIAFLHRQNVIHRDVAARNCVVDDKLMVKVSDSALSKDLFPDDYHRMGEAESRPVKWMPPEVILQSMTSTHADMWSFGVLLWELATLAQQPYAEIEFRDVVPYLKMNYRLTQPVNCPDELYESMRRCWTWDCDNRPKWTYMLNELQRLHTQLALYV